MNGDEGWTVVRTAGTAVSAATERGNTVTDQQHQESSEDFGGTVGKGKAAARGVEPRRTRRADRAVGHGCRCVVQLCLQYDTRQEYNSEQERACDATHRNSETDPRAIAGYRAAVRAADRPGNKLPVQKKPHASRTPWPCPLPDARARPTRFARRAAAPYPHIQPCSEVSAPPPGP